MKTPDKFERMVLKISSPDFSIHSRDAIKLLRRQHAAYARMVRNEKVVVEPGGSGEAGDIGYNHACDDILEQFANYKR